MQGGGGGVPPAPRPAATVGLACEWFNLTAAGLSQSVVNTIQNTRTPSTRSLYGNKWKVFERWRLDRNHVPFQCSVPTVLAFLQDLIDKRKAFSMVKVYLADIPACHINFGDKAINQHPLDCCFMKSACRLLPVSRPLLPPWDRVVVLEGLGGPPFEPLLGTSLKHLSLKAALLLASAKHKSDIHVLSVQFALGNTVHD